MVKSFQSKNQDIENNENSLSFDQNNSMFVFNEYQAVQ